MINGIIAEVHLSFALSSEVSVSAMTDFKVSKPFRIPLKSNRTVTSTEVHWLPPKFGCVKINIDGSSMILLFMGILVQSSETDTFTF
jgi:hypothetical protein